MSDPHDKPTQRLPGGKPGIWSEEVQRAAAIAVAARRVNAEPGNLFSLANYRRAREAAAFLNQTLNRVPWVRCVHAGYTADQTPIIVIVARYAPSEMDRRCAPSGVNDVAVEIRVDRCRRARCPGVSC
jgi:hypothetical protein